MITIIIPTFKPQEYLLDCLKSIKDQDIDEYEVLIVLNGIRDPYYKMIKMYISRTGLDAKCKLVYTSDKGVSRARNLGLDMIKNGENVVFLDDDDAISSNYLSSLSASLISDKSIAISNTKSFTGSDPSVGLVEDYLYNKYINRETVKKGFFYHRSFFSVVWGKIIPFNVIQNIRFDESFANGEDALFMASISKNIEDICYSDIDTLYYRRIRPESASQGKKTLWSNFLNSMRLFFAYLKVYLSAPIKYNFLFFLSRYIAVFRVLFEKPF